METQLLTYLFGAGVLAIAMISIFQAAFFKMQEIGASSAPTETRPSAT